MTRPATTSLLRRLVWLRGVLLPIATALLCLLAWHLVVAYGNIPPVILPPPKAVWLILSNNMPLLLQHAWPTFVESLLGFAIATALGIVLAVAITYSRLLREAIYPHLVIFQLIPKVALAPLFIVWLGIGAPSRLAFATFISFFPLVVATSQGLSEVPSDMLRLANSLSATRWQVFRTIRFPYALPHIFAGMKIAVTMSMIGVIVGEFITAQRGLGYLILFAGAQAETALILAAVALLCAIGLAQFAMVALLERVVRRIYG
ncbi:ABC transporter permease [Humitalea sp. 24SJ18S-53]|uniref:ABC transporter permease n=1 Tax=Humitalea sp. 24SJ18S-53 TaxID=3422307 RepID=UPI003D67EDC7